MKKPEETPLTKYLKKKGFTQSGFARQFAAYRGKKTNCHPVIWNWTTGMQAPSDSLQTLLEMMTGGQVSRKAWAKWSKKKAR